MVEEVAASLAESSHLPSQAQSRDRKEEAVQVFKPLVLFPQ